MPQFVHLHVHTQYSILDGQASIQRLVDKAMADGQPGIAVTDHGDMFGIKEFYNYVQKVKGKCKDKAAEAEARIAALRDGTETCADPASEIAKCEKQLEECRRKLAFKPIIGCEVYVARRRLHDKEGKPDQSGYHLILLAKNLKGYHNLIKIVSKAKCRAPSRPTTSKRPRSRSDGTRRSSATTITSNCSSTRPPSSGPTTRPTPCSCT